MKDKNVNNEEVVNQKIATDIQTILTVIRRRKPPLNSDDILKRRQTIESTEANTMWFMILTNILTEANYILKQTSNC